jgi:hypothetical protein
LSDESVILDDDNAIYEYPAGSDPYSFRITYNTDEDDSFEGDPFIDMDIRETLYNSEVMKELRKDN